MCRKNSGCESGQTLIEVVAALGVAVVVISSILGLITASNRKATLARQDSEATKLVQEGLEIVRNTRDTNAVIKAGYENDGGGPVSCVTAPTPCTFNALYTYTQGTFYAHLDNSGQEILDNPPSATDNEAQLLGGVFRREIIISDDPIGNPSSICLDSSLTAAQVKRVTVEVDWGSPSGTQTKKATTCLTPWR